MASETRGENSNCRSSGDMVDTQQPFAHDIVVTIDGPAGAGKSSVARLLAERLGFEFLDTGAMYRAVTYAVLTRGVNPADEAAVDELAKNLHFELNGHSVRLDGQDVSESIRTPEVSVTIGLIADNVAVRRRLSQWQRDWVKGRRVVTEGRDQGSEVFLHSPCKIFLVASCQERAKRRQVELSRKGIELDWQTVLEQQNRRDEQDRSRPVGALRKAVDSIEFCTDGMSLEQVVEQLEQLVRNRLSLPSADSGGCASCSHDRSEVS